MNQRCVQIWTGIKPCSPHENYKAYYRNDRRFIKNRVRNNRDYYSGNSCRNNPIHEIKEEGDCAI